VKSATRNIFSHVIPMVLLSWLVLLGVTALLELQDELAKVNENYTMADALGRLLYTTPRRAYDYFVYAGVIGSVIGLGIMAQASELVALQAVGMSRGQIVRRVLLAVGILTSIVFVGAEWWGSTGDRMALEYSKMRNRPISLGSGNTLWIKDGTAFFNARTVISGEKPEQLQLWGVRILIFDAELNLQRLISAKTASYNSSGWQLQSVRDQSIEPDRASSATLDHMTWPTNLEPEQISSRSLKPNQLSIMELRRTIAYAKDNQLDYQAFSAAFWKRLCFPLAVLSLVLAAAPFAFGSLRTGGLGRSIFLGLLLAILFFVLQTIVANLFDTFRWPMWLGYTLPPFAVSVFGLWRLRRA
jgi:lipopolysaccharide export system permease protein